MKAIVINRYGGPEVVEYTDLPDPKVGPDSVLVEVRAAGVNPVDWKVREGALDGVLDAHFPLVMGWDAAGVVRAVGGGVTEFARATRSTATSARTPSSTAPTPSWSPRPSAPSPASRPPWTGRRRAACRWPGSARCRP